MKDKEAAGYYQDQGQKEENSNERQRKGKRMPGGMSGVCVWEGPKALELLALLLYYYIRKGKLLGDQDHTQP